MLKRALCCQALLITVICVVESPSHCLSSCRGLVALQEYSEFVLCLPGDLFDMLLPMLSIYQEYVRNHHYCLQVSLIKLHSHLVCAAQCCAVYVKWPAKSCEFIKERLNLATGAV